jgi:flagellar basal body-associated protein FliL
LIKVIAEMQEKDETYSRDTFDDLGDDSGSEAVPEEEQFTTNESDEQADSGGEASPKEGDSQIREKRYRGKWWIAVGIAIILCLVTGVTYLSMRNWRSAKGYHQTEEGLQRYRLAIPKDQLVPFPSFVIPFHGGHKFAYISLSISFNVPSNELRGEMREKEGLLRGIIYDMLNREVNKVKEIPSLKKLKELILREVNTVLFTGELHQVYITNFLAI